MLVLKPGYNPPGYRWDFPLDGTNSPEGTEVTPIPADAKIGGKIIGLPRRIV
ncbi:hypothetical protein [Bradyrhizobium pachyrhizi]|uniref:hypothetical protein n=1 Tax=Bradyrhizobium pachyrhizi TaxID=280333 RepID=UPI000A8F7055|nr:hypothetical protein [Bradyrhizobium pachyrhizi]